METWKCDLVNMGNQAQLGKKPRARTSDANIICLALLRMFDPDIIYLFIYIYILYMCIYILIYMYRSSPSFLANVIPKQNFWSWLYFTSTFYPL